MLVFLLSVIFEQIDGFHEICVMINDGVRCYDCVMSVIDKLLSMENWRYDSDVEKAEYVGKKSVPMPLCPLQIPHFLAWD